MITVERIKKRLGCRKALPDARDFSLSVPRRLRLPESFLESLGLPRSLGLPESVDRTDEMFLQVEDQDDEPTCVGFAASAMKEWQEKKELLGQDIDLSARFIYEEARKIMAFPGGTTDLRSAMKVLKSKGVCTEQLWPYGGQQSGDVYGEAEKYKIASYAGIPTNLLKRYALFNNGPFVVGVSVFSNWSDVDQTGLVPMPDSSDEDLGGHAICVVGYDDSGTKFGSDKAKTFKFKNSWGPGWGDQGYGYIPYDYIREHSWDAWTSVDMGVPDALAGIREIAREAIRELMEEQGPATTTEVVIRVGSAEAVHILGGGENLT